MEISDRVRAALKGKRNVTEKKMFGGVCFMLREHMLCAASERGFLFRVGKAQNAAALKHSGARVMEMKGRRYEGYVRVDSDRCDGRALHQWVSLAEKHVTTLPPKRSRK